ncbi:TasA family protein [Calidifontibacillus oryziterrae]|uniref:TasA family protein n=1 Tax=Calidifontibacillus oryziterrae TaxID=1191699 RepID=UPI0002F47618|nr:TasA family protein [Calidifontibacillus oryziterrae]
MTLKKKLGMGIAAGALGLSLIGGGSWAAFNDVETTNNTFAAGTLDLTVGEASTVDFEIRNLKPGDHFTKRLVLGNNGSLDINQILVTANSLEGWENKDILNLNSQIGAGSGDNSEAEFLSQFKVEVFAAGGATALATSTLADLVAAAGTFELTGTDDATVGLAAGADPIEYDVKITFEEDDTLFAGSRLMVQNKYQGEEASVQFVFEATQMPGEDRGNDEEAPTPTL